MLKVYRYFLQLNLSYVFLILLFTLLIFPTLICNIITVFTSCSENWAEIDLPYKSLSLNIITIIFIAPVVETFIYQFLPFSLLFRALKIRPIYVIFFSSFLFGGMHYYNIIYVVYAFLSGFILIFAYIIFYKRKFYPFVMVSIIHFIINLIAYIRYI